MGHALLSTARRSVTARQNPIDLARRDDHRPHATAATVITRHPAREGWQVDGLHNAWSGGGGAGWTYGLERDDEKRGRNRDEQKDIVGLWREFGRHCAVADLRNGLASGVVRGQRVRDHGAKEEVDFQYPYHVGSYYLEREEHVMHERS